MSLHCPATLVIARHGETEYTHHADLLSDEDGRLTERGRAQATELGGRLTGRRIALVYASPLARAAETGEVAAAVLGVPLRELPGVAEFRVGDLAGSRFDDPRLVETYRSWLAGDLELRIPGAESGAEVVARFQEALSSVADLHRGETVLVISHGGIVSLGLRHLARGAPARPESFANCASIELEAGDDGWVLTTPWPSAAG